MIFGDSQPRNLKRMTYGVKCNLKLNKSFPRSKRCRNYRPSKRNGTSLKKTILRLMTGTSDSIELNKILNNLVLSSLAILLQHSGRKAHTSIPLSWSTITCSVPKYGIKLKAIKNSSTKINTIHDCLPPHFTYAFRAKLPSTPPTMAHKPTHSAYSISI